jgi:hypothetical protein
VGKLASSRHPGLPVIARRSCDWRTVICVEDGLLDLVRVETRDDVREVRKIKGSVQRPKTGGVLT